MKYLALLFMPLLACDTGSCDSDVIGAPLIDSQASAMFALNEEPLLLHRTAPPLATYTLALVPGTSEQWGHHKAPPAGTLVSDEFAARLNQARALLEAGHVGFVLVSGGSVDHEHPEYNEAERGRSYLLAQGVAADRILIDPLAAHTTSNVRNADKLAVELGLDRILIVTTTPQAATLSPGDVATQGYYLLYHAVSTFDARSERELGYRLGTFRRVRLGSSVAIEHCGFARPALLADHYGP